MDNVYYSRRLLQSLTLFRHETEAEAALRYSHTFRFEEALRTSSIVMENELKYIQKVQYLRGLCISDHYSNSQWGIRVFAEGNRRIHHDFILLIIVRHIRQIFDIGINVRTFASRRNSSSTDIANPPDMTTSRCPLNIATLAGLMLLQCMTSNLFIVML